MPCCVIQIKSKGTRGGLAGLLLLVTLNIALRVPALAQKLDYCPPPKGKSGPAGPVPGKPSEMGWLLHDDEHDDAGNKIQEWCLKANKDHGGPDFAKLFKPKGAKDEDAVWIGACTFPDGKNIENKKGEDKDGNGVPDLFTKLTWLNIQSPSLGTNDWDYSYDPATNKLIVNKTTGTWVKGTDPETGKIKGNYYKDKKVVDTDTYDAPKEFKGLHFKDTQISYLSGHDGTAIETFGMLFETVSPTGLWTYGLRVNEMGGSGTDSDPFVGVLASLIAGDTLSVAADGIQNPFVSGLAAQPQYGGWVVARYTNNSVIFMATVSADFGPGTLIEGFGFSSGATSAELMPWDLASSNELIGSSGTVLAPANSSRRK